MEILFLLGGVVLGLVVGSLFTRLRIYDKAGSGYFRLDPIEDEDNPEVYTISVAITPGQALLTKDHIILKRDLSQK